MRLKQFTMEIERSHLLKEENAKKSDLINFISRYSNRYGDKLLHFMDTYHLDNLSVATVDQLREYIATYCGCSSSNENVNQMVVTTNQDQIRG